MPVIQKKEDDVDEKRGAKSIMGRLRKGYVVRQGTTIIEGPEDVSLNAKTARLYLHMMDNREEIIDFFGMAKDPKFLTYEEQMTQLHKDMEKRRGADGVVIPVGTEEIEAEVGRQTATLREEVETLRAVLEAADIDVEAIATNLRKKKEKAAKAAKSKPSED